MCVVLMNMSSVQFRYSVNAARTVHWGFLGQHYRPYCLFSLLVFLLLLIVCKPTFSAEGQLTVNVCKPTFSANHFDCCNQKRFWLLQFESVTQLWLFTIFLDHNSGCISGKHMCCAYHQNCKSKWYCEFCNILLFSDY